MIRSGIDKGIDMKNPSLIVARRTRAAAVNNFDIRSCTSIFVVQLRCPPFRAKATLAPARMPTQCILSLRELHRTCLPPVCTKNIERRAKYGTFELTYDCCVRSYARITTAKEGTRQHFGTNKDGCRLPNFNG